MKKVLVIGVLLFIFKTEAQTSVLTLADSLFNSGYYAKSIAHYKAYNPQRKVYYKIAGAYKTLGNYDEALAYFEKAIEATPENLSLKYDYAKLLLTVNKTKAAQNVFRELVEADSLNPDYQY